MLLKLTLRNNKTVLVNTDCIKEITPSTDDDTFNSIFFIDGTVTIVVETLEEIHNQWLSTWEV